MKSIAKLSVLLLVLFLTACSPGFVVHSDGDRRVNLRNYSTYQIVEATGKPQDPILDNQFNRERVENAIHHQLSNRNFEAVAENPELKVMFYSDRRDRQETQYTNSTSPWGWGFPRGNTYTRSYTENTLIIDVVDAKTNKLVWQGWAAGEMERSMKNPEKVIAEKVRGIFNEFPVRPTGQTGDQLYGAPVAG
jgi:hypothetical protein